MDFEWDENKRLRVLAKHGVDFRTIAGAWLDEAIHGYRSDKEAEERYVGLATVKGRRWAVIFTLREGRIRLISARKWKNRDDRRVGPLHP
jgi:uncharacterized DUF497 family protein